MFSASQRGVWGAGYPHELTWDLGQGCPGQVTGVVQCTARPDGLLRMMVWEMWEIKAL